MSDWYCANCGERSSMMGHYSSSAPSGFSCEPKANGGKGAPTPEPTDPAGVSEIEQLLDDVVGVGEWVESHFDVANAVLALSTPDPVLGVVKEALEKIRAISSKPTYPGNNLRDIDSIARAALQTINEKESGWALKE